MDPIPTTGAHALENGALEVPCRIRVGPVGKSPTQVARATLGQDLKHLPHLASIIYAWGVAFFRYIALRFGRYVQNNPLRFVLQATTGVISIAALITVPVLGAIGFGTIGPVAGSVAAGWQASIGAVEAGSLFALCQSAAMGGAAATGLAVTGAATGVASGVTSVKALLPNSDRLREMFGFAAGKPRRNAGSHSDGLSD